MSRRKLNATQRAWFRSTVPVRDFIRWYGSESYQALPKEAFVRDGYRKGIAHQWLFDAGLLGALAR